MYSLYAHGKILHAKYACRLFFRIYISYPRVSYALGKCIQSQGCDYSQRKKPQHIPILWWQSIVYIPATVKQEKNSSITAISKIQLKEK